jgi:arylsulfatase
MLVIAVDGLRADHLTCYGYDRRTTPELDELARDGVRFENAFTTAPAAFQALASLLTGCDPLVSKRFLPPDVPPTLQTHWYVSESAPHLAYELLRNGWRTAAFLDDDAFAGPFGLARGFNEFQELESGGDAGSQSSATLDRLARWLDENDANERWFALVHLGALRRTWESEDREWDAYFEPRAELDRIPPTAEAVRVFHAIPRRRWSGGMKTLGAYEAEYDGALRRLDTLLGRAFDGLRTAGRMDRTTIVVLGTRGMGLGEAGLYLDSGTLADVDLHVPLIVRPARELEALRGGSTRALASVVDLAPTLLDLAELPLPAGVQGVSLRRALADPTAPTREFAFAGSGYQSGSCVLSARYCFEVSEPWNTGDAASAISWYGGALPTDPKPRVVLHDREQDRSIGHQRSAPLEESLVAPMRDAEARWSEATLALRRRLQTADWLDFGGEASSKE